MDNAADFGRLAEERLQGWLIHVGETARDHEVSFKLAQGTVCDREVMHELVGADPPFPSATLDGTDTADRRT